MNSKRSSAARAAALALSAALLAAPAWAEESYSNKTADVHNGAAAGGAVYEESNSIIFNSSDVELNIENNFAGNADEAYGAAFYSGKSISLEVSQIKISGNSADAQGAPGTAQGGAIWAKGDIELNAGKLTAKGNSATSAHSTAQGGTLYSETSISLTADELDYSDSFVSAAGANANAQGGAIYADGDVSLTGTEKIVLSGNSADVTGEVDAWGNAEGGAVFSEAGEIRVEGGTVEITNNVVSADQGDAQGGALFTRSGNVNISGDSVTISSNAAYAGMRPQEEHTMGDEAHAYGGAVDATGALYVESTGTITISDNSAESRLVRLPEASGGALYSKGDMTVSGDKLNITNNHVRANEEGAMAEGGALYGEEGAERLLLHGSEILLSGNSADAEGEDAEAYGGAILGKLGAAVSIDSRGALTVTDNRANVSGDAGYAKGGAIMGNRDQGDDAVALKGVQVLLSGNEAQAKGEDTAAYGGAVYATYGNITLTGSETLELSGNAAKATGSYAYARGGAIMADHDSDFADYDGGDVNLSTLGTLSLSGNSAVADGDESQAVGGVVWTTGDVIFSGATIEVHDNYASASGADSTAWGGAIFAGGDAILTADDSIVFSGNYAESGTLNKKASLGGAVYAIGNAEMTAKTLEFATDTDDVFARGSITLTGALTAAPGTAFTAGGQFAMGADNTSSLMLTAQPFTDVAAERKPGDLTIFGGAADTANGAENAIDFNRAPLTVHSTGMYARDGRAYMDVATVLYRNDPQLITSGNSADITEETWAPDVSAYRGGKLYIHSAVTKTDEQTSAIQDALELGYTAKLVLAYDRRALIWRAQDAPWNEAVAANTAWVQGSDDIFTPYVEDDSYVADSFWRGDVVVFDGKVYDELTPGAEKPASGVVEVPIDAAGVAPAQVYVTGGQNHFTGGPLSAGKLFVRGSSTSADFAGTVNAADLVSVDQAAVSFAELAAQVSTPVEIGGTVAVKNAANGVYTVSEGGNLTLAGGTGTLTGLTLNSGAALNVNTLSSYSVSDSFSALGGSVTYFGFDSWAPDDNSAWAIGGGSSAVLSSGAKLTIAGITPGDTGKWTLLSGFKIITADGWTADDITIADYDLSDYTVKAYIDGADYVLEISREKPEPPTPPDGDLIWNGTGSDTWSVSTAKPWLVASSADLDKPYEEGGSTYPSAFADGKTVTFNAIGKAQQNVTVNGDVSAGQVRVTAGEYKFGGDGKITAKELLTAGSGTTAVFDTPLSVKEKLDIGADTKAKLADLSMELNAPAAVAGRLELAKAAGGVFTVNKGGELTLAGGKGSLTGLTVESGATLNVNALSSYSVTDRFSALGGSVTYFSFDNWRADDSSAWGISGGGTAEADLGSGAKLTVSGIKLGAGKWTLLSGFKSITAGGWSKDDITFADYDDLSGYTVAAYDDGAGNYVLEITKEEPVPPDSGDPGHTEAFHIASSAQSSVSAAAEKAALGLLSVEPTVEKALWAHVWRDTGRVYDADSALSQKNRAYGIVIGRDLGRNEKSTWGVAAHIGKGDTSGKGAWDGSTSNTDFAGVLLYGRHETGRWLLTGDAGMSWLRTDYNEAGGAKADNARSTMFSVGGRAYYKWVENNAPGKMNVSPFLGLRWNRYRQSAYDYDSGDRSAAYTADQLLVPMGVKFSWGESVSKKGWRTAPSFELSYIRAFGDRSAKTGIAAKGQKNTLADTPLSDRDTFSAQVRYGARRNNFQWDLNVGVRRSSSETDHAVGATFRWDL